MWHTADWRRVHTCAVMCICPLIYVFHIRCAALNVYAEDSSSMSRHTCGIICVSLNMCVSLYVYVCHIHIVCHNVCHIHIEGHAHIKRHTNVKHTAQHTAHRPVDMHALIHVCPLIHACPSRCMCPSMCVSLNMCMSPNVYVAYGSSTSRRARVDIRVSNNMYVQTAHRQVDLRASLYVYPLIYVYLRVPNTCVQIICVCLIRCMCKQLTDQSTCVRRCMCIP